MSAPRLVLVEGASDRIALTTLALRLGRDLDAEGVDVVEMGGATNIRRHLREALARRPGLGVTGLYDVAEERYVRRALTDVGLGPVTDRGRVEQLGFFACEADLEDELIRAVGERRMLEVIDDNGDGALRRGPRARDAVGRRPAAAGGADDPDVTRRPTGTAYRRAHDRCHDRSSRRWTAHPPTSARRRDRTPDRGQRSAPLHPGRMVAHGERMPGGATGGCGSELRQPRLVLAAVGFPVHVRRRDLPHLADVLRVEP